MRFDCCSRALRAAVSIGAVSGVLFAGCATPTPTVEPNAGVPLPQAWSNALSSSAMAASDAGWWASFNDALMTRLVTKANERNTGIATAQANLRQARALRNQAAAALMPSLSAGAGAQATHGQSGASHLFDASLDASWEADLFGANGHAVAAQESLVRASTLTLASTRVSVEAEVALAYLNLRSAQTRAAIARDNLASQEATLQIARWREKAGLASSLEVEQARTSVEQTRAQIPVLQSGAATSAHSISVLTGEPPESLLNELMSPAALPRPSTAAIAPPAQTLRRRPDVLAAEEQLRAAAQQVGQADANRYPQLTLQASAQWSGLTLGSLGSVAAARSLVASLFAPLFDAGLRSAQLDQRQAQFDIARESYRAAILGALQEVEDALVALQSTSERLAALRNALDAARNASTLATQRYSTGVIDFLTVLETQRTLLNAQDSVAASEAELAADRVRLYKALGGGWSITEDKS
jgi:NodT family efflux transporter outer membrane factor (OMF) lipoprotein